MKDIDTKKIEDIIRHVAATEVMPRWKNLQQGDIREKNPGDLVTVADEASEKLFTELLRDALPGSLVVGEEAVSKDRAVIERFRGDEPVWVIDPVDGTYNFAHGSKKFGILVALVQGGQTRLGFAFDAPGNRMSVAAQGAGTYLDGVRMKVESRDVPFEEFIVRGGGDRVRARVPFREVVNQRCSLHDYMDFITGAADAIIHGPRVTPWDHAANNLIAAEAGAHVAMNNADTAYDPTLLGPAFLMVAQDRAWWEKLHAALQRGQAA